MGGRARGGRQGGVGLVGEGFEVGHFLKEASLVSIILRGRKAHFDALLDRVQRRGR